MTQMDKNDDLVAAGQLSFNFFLYDGTEPDLIALEQWLQTHATEGFGDAETKRLLFEVLKSDLLAVVDGRLWWWRLYGINQKDRSEDERAEVNDLMPFGGHPATPSSLFNEFLVDISERQLAKDLDDDRRVAIENVSGELRQGYPNEVNMTEPDEEEYRREFLPGLEPTINLGDKVVEAIALFDAVQMAKISGSSVEIDGMKIQPCDAYGRTADDVDKPEPAIGRVELSKRDNRLQLLSILGNLDAAKKAEKWVESE